MSHDPASTHLSVATSGGGPDLWLFHSMLADRTSFEPVLGPLAERFTVHLPELPGFGASAQVEGGLAAVADRMADAIGAAGRGPALVLGNGYGGFVALQMVLRHPGLASRMVLADAGARFSEPGRQAFRAMAERARTLGLEAVGPVAMRRLFAEEFGARHPELMAARLSAFLRTRPEVLIETCGELSRLDLLDDVPSVAVPTLVLVGEHDEATPPEMSRELAARLPDARLAVLPGCAHVPQLQHPSLFLDHVLPFLLGTAAAG